jgi:hypothetical protein
MEKEQNVIIKARKKKDQGIEKGAKKDGNMIMMKMTTEEEEDEMMKIPMYFRGKYSVIKIVIGFEQRYW